MAFAAKKQVLACLLQTFTPYAQSRSLLKYVNLRICEISPINLALMQVALIAASCCAGPIRSVVVLVVGVACCAASHTDCADAAPDLCTLCLDCTLHPDLCTLCLWCLFSFNLCNHSTCTGDGCYQLQLALVVVFIQPLAQILYVHSGTCSVWW